MAAPEGNQNAKGNKGTTLNDRIRMSHLRGLVLEECIAILEKPKVELTDREYELRNEILKGLARNVLPRLAEVTGEDGEAIKVTFDSVFNAQSTPKTEGDSSIAS